MAGDHGGGAGWDEEGGEGGLGRVPQPPDRLSLVRKDIVTCDGGIMAVERGGMRRVGRAVLVESPSPLTGSPKSRQRPSALANIRPPLAPLLCCTATS
jgi:hypothetical protein